MSIIVSRLLFICLIGPGVLILIKIIPVLGRMIGEKPLFSLPLTQPAGVFQIPEPGNFSIWQKGTGMRKTRIEMEAPSIFDQHTGGKLPLHRTGAMITANDGSGLRRQLFTFSAAAAGEYRIELPPGFSPEKTDTSPSLFSRKNAASFALEIRKPMPVIKMVFCILSLLVAAFCIIAGLVGASSAK